MIVTSERILSCQLSGYSELIKMPRLFLGNLGHDCRQRDIEKLFDGYGELRNINIKVSAEATNILSKCHLRE